MTVDVTLISWLMQRLPCFSTVKLLSLPPALPVLDVWKKGALLSPHPRSVGVSMSIPWNYSAKEICVFSPIYLFNDFFICISVWAHRYLFYNLGCGSFRIVLQRQSTICQKPRFLQAVLLMFTKAYHTLLPKLEMHGKGNKQHEFREEWCHSRCSGQVSRVISQVLKGRKLFCYEPRQGKRRKHSGTDDYTCGWLCRAEILNER